MKHLHVLEVFVSCQMYISHTVCTNSSMEMCNQAAFVRNCTPCQLLISSFNTSLTILCCFITVKPLNLGDSISIAYIDPQPPLISWTYVCMSAIVFYTWASSVASACRSFSLDHYRYFGVCCADALWFSPQRLYDARFRNAVIGRATGVIDAKCSYLRVCATSKDVKVGKYCIPPVSRAPTPLSSY
jgi:hypothetical protein